MESFGAMREAAVLVVWRVQRMRALFLASREAARRRALHDIVAEHQALLTGYRGRRSFSS